MYQFQHVDSHTAWSDLVSQSFVPLRSEAVSSGRFRASLATNMLGGIGMMRISAKPHAVQRTEPLAAAGDGKYFKVSLQLTGHGLLVQDGRQVLLAPGELAIYDTQRPYSLAFEREATTMVVMIPHEQFRLPQEQVHQITAVKLDGRHPLAGTVTPLLHHLGEHLDQWDEHGGAPLARNASDLLATALGGVLTPASPAGGKQRQRQRIQEYIRTRLADPALCPGSIAAAHYLSVRSLHALFAAEPRPVGALIRHQRMELAAELLTDPMLAQVPIQAIGARVGLPDAAGFARAFAAHHGVSPSRYRQQLAG